MCGSLISNLFGGGTRAQPTPPTPAPPTTPPPPMPIQQAPTPMPEAPTPAPIQEDETKKKAKVKAKKVAKTAAKKGTTQLQTKKPKSGGLKGITTKQGVNTGTGGGSAGGTYS